MQKALVITDAHQCKNTHTHTIHFNEFDFSIESHRLKIYPTSQHTHRTTVGKRSLFVELID